MKKGGQGQSYGGVNNPQYMIPVNLIGISQMPIRQIDENQTQTNGPKSRNGKGTSIRHTNSIGSKQLGVTQGSMGPNDRGKKTSAMGSIGNRGNKNLKHQSVAFNGRGGDLDHPLMSATMDLTVKQNTQKDN